MEAKTKTKTSSNEDMNRINKSEALDEFIEEFINDADEDDDGGGADGAYEQIEGLCVLKEECGNLWTVGDEPDNLTPLDAAFMLARSRTVVGSAFICNYDVTLYFYGSCEAFQEKVLSLNKEKSQKLAKELEEFKQSFSSKELSAKDLKKIKAALKE